MTLSPGVRLGPYEVLAKIGQGGMGEVYRARDTRLDRDVALKILPAAFLQHPDRLARFEREAKVLASLNHPNIGHIYGLEEAEGVRALVLELVKGPTLADRMAQGTLPLADALAIAAQMADALQAAHASGIIHRDLKPDNVILGEHGPVKVMDFGLAKRLREPGTSASQAMTEGHLTRVGTILGTPAYMAPEQIVGADADERSDIFSFGVVLYELVAGVHPFRKDTQTATMTAIMRSPPTPPSGGADRTKYAIFDRLLAKEPRERYQTFADVSGEVRRMRDSTPALQPGALAVQPTTSLGGWRPSHVGRESDQVALMRASAEESFRPSQTPDGQPFVSRRRELTWLTSRLASAVGGHGQLAFVVGEAGSGKSTLLRELALRGQEGYPELLIAFSACNAQTGFGDPYLPFSQLLSALVGNLEDSKAAAVDEANAERLRASLATSGRVLVEHGPNLIDVLIPGGALVRTAARAPSGRPDWLDGLETMLRKRQEHAASTAVDQPKLFQQYADVLAHLAAERPLLLVIDDMQWADTASIALLYRLTRQLHEHRIFLIGAYRADEVSSAAGRPPLAKTLQEYKRQFGDIWLDVGPHDDEHAREFLDSFIDSYPNALDEDFRRAFLEVSRGQALFTVELFRSLVDRGVLQQDVDGRWYCASPLELSTLPARIEGVIEERVSRLDDASAEILHFACVEGEQFTAQVIARLQGADERAVVRRISDDLIARHALVEEVGEVRSGRTYLNRYRFRHALFQQHLYHRLTGAERRILHGDLLTALEAVHADDLSSVAIALGRHAQEARLDDVASAYLIMAGDTAVQKVAHSEARGFFAHALNAMARLEQTDRVVRLTLDTVVKYTNVSFAAIPPDEHLERLRKTEALAQGLRAAGEREDLLRLARLDYWIGRALHYKNDLRAAIAYYRRVVGTAEEQSASDLAAMGTAMIGRARCLQGYFAGAAEDLGQALPNLRSQQNWLEYIWAEGFFGLTLAARGRYADGLARATEALEVSQRLKFGTGIAASYILLWGVHLQGGEATQMLKCATIVEGIAQKAGDRMYVYLAHGMLSAAHYLLGDLSSARRELEASKDARRQLGGHALITDWFEALDAEILVDSEEYEKGVAQAERALAIADESDGVYAKGIAHRALAIGLAGGGPTDWTRVTENFEHSIEAFRLGEAKSQQARTYGRWSALLKREGRFQEAAAVEQRAAVASEA